MDDTRINRRSLAALLAGMCLLPTAYAQDSAPPDGTPVAVEQLEELLVIGERPGPSLWKVTGRDGNVLWILPTLGPLPDKLVWKSTQVETIIRESKEIYTDWSVHAPVRLRSKQGKRFAQATRSLPDGKTLKDVMPSDAYARLMSFKPESSNAKVEFETMRPMIVMDALNESLLKKLELTSDGGISATVARLAKENRIKVRSLRVVDKSLVDDVSSFYESASPELEGQCAGERLNRMGRDIALAVSRANAWAAGDIPKLRQDAEQLRPGGQSSKCALFYTDLNASAAQKAAAKAYATLTSALKKNDSTLALVSVGSLFAPDGLLAKLRADGYVVEDPDSAPGVAANARFLD